VRVEQIHSQKSWAYTALGQLTALKLQHQIETICFSFISPPLSCSVLNKSLLLQQENNVIKQQNQNVQGRNNSIILWPRVNHQVVGFSCYVSYPTRIPGLVLITD
jgi:hypothetical protein